ncbi:hypothetical protein [Methylophilus sp. QUAN]|nr:hypothetical protein [Methylophilus sp. QUAN]MBF4990144.1 hypothetical protein [Methylophilus sp. QUAN]
MTPQITRLIYHYQGASVPPPYHRSITLTMDVQKIHLVITSYDETLADVEQEPATDIMLQLTQWIQDYHLVAMPRQAIRPALSADTGAGIHSLMLYAGQQKIMDASTAKHADSTTAILTGDVESFARQLTQCVDHYESYMHTP